jgi:MFS family permease
MVFPPALSPLAGSLVDRHGSRGLAIGGAALAAAGCAWLAGFAPDQEYGMLVPGLVLFGLGVPLAYAAIITAGASATPASERGAGAGLVNTARWVGATVGTVAFGATLNAVRTSDLDATLAGRTLSGVEWDRIDRLVLVDEEATGTVMTGLGARVVDAVTDAFAAGYGAGLWLCAAAFVVVVIVAATTLGPRDRGA